MVLCTGGTQLLWILLESESPGLGNFCKGSTAPALRLPGAQSSCKAEMTALTLDFWVSIPVPPPSSRVTLAEFLFLPLCHGDENTGQDCAGLPGWPVQGLGPPTDGDSGPGLAGKVDPKTVAPGIRTRQGCNGGAKEGFLKKPTSQSQLGMSSSRSRSRPGGSEGQPPWPLGPRAEAQGAHPSFLPKEEDRHSI